MKKSFESRNLEVNDTINYKVFLNTGEKTT